MSHDYNNYSTDYANYFAHNLDYIDPTGTLGFNIEQDAYITSNSAGVSSSDYIIEVHYLGSPASTIKLDVENIDTNVSQVDFIVKSVSENYAASPENVWFFKDGVDDTYGLTNWSGDMGGLDPAYGLVEIDIMDGTSLAIESSLYHEVIQIDSQFIDGLNDLGSSSSSDVAAYAGMLTNSNDSVESYNSSIDDASNDILNIGVLKLDQNPEMVHIDFDMSEAYEYNASGSIKSLDDISEASLVAEFRINPMGTDWSFDTNFEFSLNPDTTIYDQNSLTYVSGVDSFDTGVLADIGTSISHDSTNGIRFAPISDSNDTGNGPDMSSVSVYSQYDLRPYTDIPDNGGYTAIWNDNGTAMAIDVEYDVNHGGYIVPADGVPYTVPFNGGNWESIVSLSYMYTIDLSNMGDGAGDGDNGAGDVGVLPAMESIIQLVSYDEDAAFGVVGIQTGTYKIYDDAGDTFLQKLILDTSTTDNPNDYLPDPNTTPIGVDTNRAAEIANANGATNNVVISEAVMSSVTDTGGGAGNVDMSTIDFYNHNFLLQHVDGVTNGGQAAAIWEENGQMLALDLAQGASGWGDAVVPDTSQPYPVSFKAGSSMADLEAAGGNKYGTIDLSNMGAGDGSSDGGTGSAYISYGVYELSVSEIDMLTGPAHGNPAGDYFIGKGPDGQIVLQSASYDTNIVDGNPWVFADGSSPQSVTLFDDTTIHAKMEQFTSAHSHSEGGGGDTELDSGAGS